MHATTSPNVRLDGNVVIITGAGGGIGTALVHTVHALGGDVVAVDLPGAGLEALRSTSALVIEGDVTSESSWEHIVSEAVAAFGRVDALVNNAGIEGAIVPMLEYPNAMFDAVVDVNIRGVWLGMKAVLGAMVEQGSGAIVNLSSVAGLGGAANLSAYSMSKHAVIGLTKSVAAEVGRNGVRVNAVCPSPIQTRMMRSLEDGMKGEHGREVVEASIAANIPIGRYGEPEEVASAIAYLLSDAAGFITGVALPVDGGMKSR